MSTTTSVRRIKERGGGGGKITATKTLTPLSDKPSLGSASKRSSGKENPNPRSISRVSGPAQKPAIRPMARMSDSRPRGRSPSPSDFTARVLSDLRKTRVSNGSDLSGFRVLDKKGFKELSQKVCDKGVNGFRVEKENANFGGKFRDFADKEKSGEKRSSSVCRKEGILSVNSVKLIVSDGSNVLDGCIDDKDGNFDAHDAVTACRGDSGSKNPVLRRDRARSVERSGTRMGCKEEAVKSFSSLKGADVCKENGVNEEGMSGQGGKKSTSKLHEKLAYLEGKVKRIASDIKKTKEMLDTDNTDASKIIISDIQEKISGIEKAMGHVMADSSLHLTVGCASDVGKGHKAVSTEIDSVGESLEVNQGKQDDLAKVSVKGLSGDELEARLFPHHKLLRDRTSQKVSATVSQSDGIHASESNGRSNSYNSVRSFEESPIELEFLASLDEVQSKVNATVAVVALGADEVKETEAAETSTVWQSTGSNYQEQGTELDLQAEERLDDFDEQENKPGMLFEEETDDNSSSQLMEIGQKTSTGGWFVSEGESVLLAHDDGSCSFYDIANQEEKAEYKPPAGTSQNIWRDCWIIRAPSADGCSGKYVVAASAGNTMDSGFCSWDFYSRDVRAFHTEDNKTSQRVALGPLPDNLMYRRNTLGGIISSENRQWWYKPCGPLIVSTASSQRAVKVFDIRDGEQIMRWDVQKPVVSMDYSSPLQWRNRGKVVIAETEAISLWDVSSLNPQPLLSVSTSGRRISALHVNNTDAELGGGVRQRVSSSEAEGNDGVFCTADSINVLDFRHPSGIGLKIPKIGAIVQSVSSRGDSVFLGCSSVTSAAKKQVSSQVLQFSLRKQRIINTYTLPESNAHSHHKALTQVWGNSNLVMAVCGLGLSVFDASRDDVLPSFAIDYSSQQKVREVVGPDDLYSPSFDFLSSQILLISRDRPAMWRHLS